MSDFNNILTSVENGTGIITINRPEVYGALTKEAKLEIIKAIRIHNRDKEVKSIILNSNGKGFCTGQDLNDRTVQAGEKPVDLGVTLETEWNPLVNAIRESKKLVIGAVEGVVAGAGVSVALACDLVIAKPGIKFVSGFAKLGLCPDAGSTFTFTRALGSKKAMEFFLFNVPLMSEQLQEKGLINMIHEQPTEIAKEWSVELNSMAPLALNAIKININKAIDSDYQSSMNRETAYQRFLGNSEDYKEGLNAFFEKRQPNFKGQ